MRKIFTLCMALVLGAPSLFAQEEEQALVFVDAKGNVVSDGAVIELRDVEGGEIDPMTGEAGALQIPTGLSVRKVTDEKVAGQMLIDISAMPNGSFQTCSFGSCLPEWTAAGVYTSAKTIVSSEQEPITTEWYPAAYATWTATLQIQYMDIVPNRFGIDQATSTVIGDGPKVTLKFIYTDPANVKGVNEDDRAVVTDRYTVGGSRLSAPQKGLNIVRKSDGTVKKVVIK